MTWVRIDDAAPLHPKLQDAGAEAFTLWVAGLAHANRHTTDGIIKKRHVEGLYPPLGKRARKLAERLVQLGLWEEFEENSYRIHDYEQYQEEAMRDAVEERKRAARERKRAQREREKARREAEEKPLKPDKDEDSHAVTPRDTSRVTGGVTPPVTSGVTPGVTHAGDVHPDMSQPPGPSRPVPARPVSISDPNGSSSESRQSRDVRRVFEHWKSKVWNGRGPEPKLDGKRKSRISARLREGLTVEQLCRAVEGALRSPWHTGDNPAGKTYLGIQTLLRDRETVEGHIERLTAPMQRPGARALTPDEFEVDEDPMEASYG